jgi:hypothetical protein
MIYSRNLLIYNPASALAANRGERRPQPIFLNETSETSGNALPEVFRFGLLARFARRAPASVMMQRRRQANRSLDRIIYLSYMTL